MKNTLKIVLWVVGSGFLVFSGYQLTINAGIPEDARRQLLGMLGVGILFIIAGIGMGKR